MIAKFPGKCQKCNGRIAVGAAIEWKKGAGASHATEAQCEAARAAAAAAPATPTIDLRSIAAFITAARDRGLKSPKLRVLAPNDRDELRLSITKGGAVPGSIAVVVAGEFIGCVRPDGQTTGKLASDMPLQTYLLRVAEDPAKAAKSYAALMGLCSFCSLPLTDAGSVEVGYGPVCAKHWGLPHSPKGSPALDVAVA